MSEELLLPQSPESRVNMDSCVNACKFDGMMKPTTLPISNHKSSPMANKNGSTIKDPQALMHKGKELADLMFAFQKSQILFSACSLGVFEELKAAAGPMTPASLAKRIQTNPDATERLLNACVAMDLLHKSDAGLFSSSVVVNMFLTKSSPVPMRSLLNNIGYMYELWGHLADGVRNGHGKKYGKNGHVCFQEGANGYYHTDAKALEFMQAMHMFSKTDAPIVVQAFDLMEFQTACDLGGGTGALAVELSRHYPHMDVSVMELPQVVRCAEHFLNEDHKVQYISGDFFKDGIPPADLYILSHVIHDWNQSKVDALLEKVYDSLDTGGALLILEKTLKDTKDGPVETIMMDLNMLVGCEGRERSQEEYRSLLRGHGFTDIQVKVLPQAKWHDAIIARKE